MREHSPQPSRDPDAELHRLLEENARDEEREIRAHIADCDCCRAQARMIARLRIDLCQLVELLHELQEQR